MNLPSQKPSEVSRFDKPSAEFEKKANTLLNHMQGYRLVDWYNSNDSNIEKANVYREYSTTIRRKTMFQLLMLADHVLSKNDRICFSDILAAFIGNIMENQPAEAEILAKNFDYVCSVIDSFKRYLEGDEYAKELDLIEDSWNFLALTERASIAPAPVVPPRVSTSLTASAASAPTASAPPAHTRSSSLQESPKTIRQLNEEKDCQESEEKIMKIRITSTERSTGNKNDDNLPNSLVASYTPLNGDEVLKSPSFSYPDIDGHNQSPTFSYTDIDGHNVPKSPTFSYTDVDGDNIPQSPPFSYTDSDVDNVPQSPPFLYTDSDGDNVPQSPPFSYTDSDGDNVPKSPTFNTDFKIDSTSQNTSQTNALAIHKTISGIVEAVLDKDDSSEDAKPNNTKKLKSSSRKELNSTLNTSTESLDAKFCDDNALNGPSMIYTGPDPRREYYY
ncbi:unnamed protein product [Bursaphelenchus okinawaensis]|uniref:Uncharacterized protein n=1 Tax=Bursaphelenchus okinawaensis TaxID=465554 RepID=A0A811KBL2_9BILA|nr:unnamed protein product [Bursaphelenchus okinawaensis]CAG9097379.1 unnamed protein product [Bursaphelenchus okinawaensis]